MSSEIKIVTATELKSNLAELLNIVSYGGKDVSILRHGKEIARLVSTNKNSSQTDKKEKIKKSLQKYAGMFPELPEYKDIKKARTTNTF